MDVSLNPGPQIVGVSENWWGGFVGMGILTHISENWAFAGGGTIGAGDSDFVWNFSAIFDSNSWAGSLFSLDMNGWVMTTRVVTEWIAMHMMYCSKDRSPDWHFAGKSK